MESTLSLCRIVYGSFCKYRVVVTFLIFKGLGLFIVYFVEELIGTFFGLKHDHSDEGTKEAFE